MAKRQGIVVEFSVLDISDGLDCVFTFRTVRFLYWPVFVLAKKNWFEPVSQWACYICLLLKYRWFCSSTCFKQLPFKSLESKWPCQYYFKTAYILSSYSSQLSKKRWLDYSSSMEKQSFLVCYSTFKE